MAQHGTITGYQKLRCRKTDACPASPTCAEVKAAARVPVSSQSAPRVKVQPAGLTPHPGSPPAAPQRLELGPQGKAVRDQWAHLDAAVRGKVAVLLAAAQALAFVIDFGAPGLVAPAVKALREVEAEIQDRTGEQGSDDFSRLMASLADVPAPVRNPAELGA